MSIEPTPAPLRLHSLQSLRAVAALLVVIFHSVQIWRELVGTSEFTGVWDRGWAGVDLFFVISGFVMVWVAGGRAAGVGTAARFLWDRVTRVYPLWWVFCALMALYFLVTYGQPASPATHTSATAWGMFARSMLLWPQGEMPVLAVGWTLIYEMAFYGVFGLLLLVSAKWRPIGLIAWGVILLLLWNVTPADSGLPSSWSLTLANSLCLEFLIGAAVAYGLKAARIPAPAALAVAAIGVLAFIAAMVFASGFDADALNRSRVLGFGLSSGLIVFGIVGWEISGHGQIAGWLRKVGDASYTLYLSHFLVLLVLKRVFEQVGLFTDVSVMSVVGFTVVGVGGSVISALILYRLVERPLLRLTRVALAKRAAPRQS
ncbi:acyltransferase [Algimonas arctica]|uniref:Acyltransferase n=1 Tax=Algimonas arctica TaxID=1479486 RepID=A0A8J3CTJ0_9PROT|nr:acyltransferase [Algimonas arctica]GHA97396.1 acyltransferase [Algimonas arctica]